MTFAFAAMIAAQLLPEAPAQPASQQAPVIESTAQSCCVLPALVPVSLTIDEPLASDKARIGQYFKLSLRAPVKVSDTIVIPAGTPGMGQVVHAAKSRAMGKAGELLLAARYIEYQGIRIPLRSLRYGSAQGKDNVGTAVIVSVAVSALVTPFITGGEVRIPAGTEVWAKVGADVPFPLPPSPVESSLDPTKGDK